MLQTFGEKKFNMQDIAGPTEIVQDRKFLLTTRHLGQ